MYLCQLLSANELGWHNSFTNLLPLVRHSQISIRPHALNVALMQCLVHIHHVIASFTNKTIHVESVDFLKPSKWTFQSYTRVVCFFNSVACITQVWLIWFYRKLLGVPARAGSYRVKSPLVEKDTFVCTMTFLFCSVHQFSLVFTLIYEIYSYIKDDQNDVNRNFHKL